MQNNRWTNKTVSCIMLLTWELYKLRWHFFKKQRRKSDRKIGKHCSSMLPFKKVIWKHSGPLGSRRRKPAIQWREMAGSGRHFRGASKYSVIWAWVTGCDRNGLEKHEGALWLGRVLWAMLSSVDFMLFICHHCFSYLVLSLHLY